MNSLADSVAAADLAQTENLELLSRRIVDGFLSGRHRSNLKGGSAEFAEHRPYCPGDEIRLLDWRVFGRNDRYCIKQFKEETSLQAVLALDTSGSMGFGLSTASKFEYGRAAALCLARLVLQQGDSAGLAALGSGIRVWVPARAQPRHLDVLLERLRDLRPSGPTSLASDLGALAQRIKRRGLILLLSDCFDEVEQLAHSLRLLRSRRHEVILFHILAPEELSFSFQQWTQFESLEDERYRLDLDPLAIRQQYLARLEQFLERIRRACGEAACDYVPLPTDQPLGQALAQYLRRRAASQT